MLIECKECGKEVSNKAESCVNCGNPLKTAQHGVDRERLTTTQVTGKSLKLFVLLAWFLIIGGIVASVNASTDGQTKLLGTFSVMGGIFLYITTKFRIWWNHK